MRIEESALLLARRESPHRVEARLPDGDRLGMLQELAQLVDPTRLGLGSLMRVDAERGVYPSMAVGDRRARRGSSRFRSRS